MLNSKKQKLFEVTEKVASVENNSNNPFINFGLKKTAETLSNGSLKYNTSGDEFVDQFSNVSKYLAQRPYNEIENDCNTIWSINKVDSIKFIMYLRMITRPKTFVIGYGLIDETQRGAGLRYESIIRMYWLYLKNKQSFYNNLPIFISVGSWKDIITMLNIDLQYNGWEDRKLDWNFIGKVILSGLENEKTSDLVKKYLPSIRTKSDCRTLESQADNMIGKWICSLLFGTTDNTGKTYKQYRKLKSSGKAHEWQQLISQNNFLQINWNTVGGKALINLVSGKFIKNNNLEEIYSKWIESKPVANFNGYPYELAVKITNNLESFKKLTIDKQFNKLVETAKKGLVDNGIRPISVCDHSGSMSSPMYIGNGQVGELKSIQVQNASVLFFNEMYPNSPFYNTYLSFSNKTNMVKFKGSSFTEKYLNLPNNGNGSTNFESVFDFFVQFRKENPTVNENEIPNFILCWSDGEFNSVRNRVETNVQFGLNKLKTVYSDEFVNSFGICFIDLPNTFYSNNPTTKFETFGNTKNVYYFSGYDLSPLSFLFGVKGQTSIPKTAKELFESAMNQTVLNLVQ